MKPYYDHGGISIYLGDCREILPTLPKVDLVLTDPPYGIGLEYASFNDTRENVMALIAEVFPLLRCRADRIALTCSTRQIVWYPSIRLDSLLVEPCREFR